MAYYLGVDPDLHTTAAAVTCPGRIVAVKVFRIPAKLKGQSAQEAMVRELLLLRDWLDHRAVSPTRIVVEGQQVYAGGQTKNWTSILALGPVSGAAALAALMHAPDADLRIPRPQAWKGSIPKQVHQRRVLRRRGIEFHNDPRGFPVVLKHSIESIDGAEEIRPSAWSHVIDAIGLADWGMSQR